jgi:hypothetical protein
MRQNSVASSVKNGNQKQKIKRSANERFNKRLNWVKMEIKGPSQTCEIELLLLFLLFQS